MTDGDVASRKELLMMDVFSFYGHLEAQEDIVDKRIKDIEKRRAKAKR